MTDDEIKIGETYETPYGTIEIHDIEPQPLRDGDRIPVSIHASLTDD